MKVKLLKTLRIKGKAARPVKDELTTVDISENDFARLEAAGAVARLTKDEARAAASSADVPQLDSPNPDQATAAAASESKIEESLAADEKIAADNSAAVDEKIAADKAAADKAAADKPRGRKAAADKEGDL